MSSQQQAWTAAIALSWKEEEICGLIRNALEGREV